jgi:Tol biopolymer transport system component
MAASNGKLGHGYDYDVYRLDIVSGAVGRLTKGNGFATDLKVSADGATAAFLKWRLDGHHRPVTSEIYVLDVQTEKVTPLKITGFD